MCLHEKENAYFDLFGFVFIALLDWEGFMWFKVERRGREGSIYLELDMTICLYKVLTCYPPEMGALEKVNIPSNTRKGLAHMFDVWTDTTGYRL